MGRAERDIGSGIAGAGWQMRCVVVRTVSAPRI